MQTDHAAASETSLMMALRPELVEIGNLPKNLSEKPLGLLGEDPREYANVASGRRIIDLQLNNMKKILRECLDR